MTEALESNSESAVGTKPWAILYTSLALDCGQLFHPRLLSTQGRSMQRLIDRARLDSR